VGDLAIVAILMEGLTNNLLRNMYVYKIGKGGEGQAKMVATGCSDGA